jgi:hypothetical protein
VSAGTGSAAATVNGIPAGIAATWSAAAMNCSAQLPAGSECVVTASPGRSRRTPAPTETTSPAASTPSAIGGRAPVSQPPVLTNSSQLPTPLARTASSTSPARGGPGSGSSSGCIADPIRSAPAARIWSALPV